MNPTQLNGQQQQLNSNGHPDRHVIHQQKPSHVGDGLEGVSVVALNDDEEQRSLKSVTSHLHSPSSSSSDSSSSFNGGNGKDPEFEAEQIPSLNMQSVNVHDPNVTAAALPPLSPAVTPTPSSVSSMSHPHRHPSQSDPISHQASLAVPSQPGSRVNLRMSGVGSDAKRQSLGIQLSQSMDDGSVGGSVTSTASSLPLGSPHKLSFTQSQINPQTSSSSTEQATSSTMAEPFVSSDPIPTPTITPTATATAISSQPPAHVYIKVRDFGFPPTDERHLGLGADTPKANRVHRLNRKLGGPDRARARTAAALDPSSSSAASALAVEGGKAGTRRKDSIASVGSVDSSDADVEEEEEDDGEGWGTGIGGWGKGGGKGWDGFKFGMGRFSWAIGSGHSNIRNGNRSSDNNKDKDSKTTSTTNGIFPSRKDLDMNFMDSSSSSSSSDEQQGRTVEQRITEEFNHDNDDDFDESVRHTGDDEDGDEGDGEPQEPLYPGLYRALYAFEPEGTAEMKLVEDQMVRVVGRGGGVGWAVVIDEHGWDGDEEGTGKVLVKHALVPEGYLEAVRLDWEDEEEEEEEGLENKDGGGDPVYLSYFLSKISS